MSSAIFRERTSQTDGAVSQLQEWHQALQDIQGVFDTMENCVAATKADIEKSSQNITQDVEAAHITDARFISMENDLQSLLLNLRNFIAEVKSSHARFYLKMY